MSKEIAEIDNLDQSFFHPSRSITASLNFQRFFSPGDPFF